MGRLELRLDKHALGGDLNLAVVASVRQIKDASGEFPADPLVQEIVIPAGRYLRREVEVPAGTYRIEARLPSGEVLHQTRKVTNEADSVDVIFELGHSPHEWLTWQRLAGNVPSQMKYEEWLKKLGKRLAEAAAKETAVSIDVDPEAIKRTATFLRGLHLRVKPFLDALARVFTREIEEPSADEATPALTEPPEFELVQASPIGSDSLWDALASMPAWNAWRKSAGAHAECSFSRQDDRELTLWHIDQTHRERCIMAGPKGPMPRRCWAISRRGGGVDVITLPVPWPLTPEFPPASIEILREAGTSTAGRTTVTVCDSNLSGMLFYLGSGKLGEAGAVLAEAQRSDLVERLISDKERNPLAACAVAYVGLAIMSVSDQPRWGPWLENVKNWFEWLPDGAVVYAAYRIKTAKNRADLDAALAALKEAYRRGIPFYAAGIQHLTQGLYTFSAKDKDANAMHKKVRQIALCIDANQAFSVITVPEASANPA